MMSLILLNNKTYDEKSRRLYQRLDEIKERAEKTYTRKDMCELQHKLVNDNFETVKATLAKIELKVDKIAANGHK